MTIGIRLKIDPSGLHRRCISGDFPQLLELPLLKTHIGGCFQSVREAAVCRIFANYIGKQTWRSRFKVRLCENSKNSYFPKRPLRVSVPFGLRVIFIFLGGYRKVWIIAGGKLWRLEIAYLMCYYKKVFWKYAANLKENAHAKVRSQWSCMQLYWNRTSAWIFL